MEEADDRNIIEDEDGNLEDGEVEQESEEKVKERNNTFLKAAIEGDLEKVKKLLDKGANLLHEDKKKWNALIWATCKGHIHIVRVLLERDAGEPYKARENLLNTPAIKETEGYENSIGLKGALTPEKKVGLGIINNGARSTPLLWACFKGHHQILCLLLNSGQDLLETDSFGNNAIHQAAAGGSLRVMEILFQHGIKLEYKNNRGHSIADLCTNPKALKYLQKNLSTKDCGACKHVFGANELKYLCAICDQFVCKDSCEKHWLYDFKDSEYKEKLECRCFKCHGEVLKMEENLQDIMKSYNHTKLTEVLLYIEEHKIHINVKLLDQAYTHQEKLRTQNMIMDQIVSLKEVENYKTIKKSINTTHEMIDDAKKRNVDLDYTIIEKVNNEVARLEAERNLRFEVDNVAVMGAKPEEVKTLEELKISAQERNVAHKYLEDADVISTKMSKNIDARNILKNFSEYPRREFYPPPYYLDLKTKKYMDGMTRKPIDPNLLQPPPQKRGKKAAKWVLPEWATETVNLGKQIKLIEEYLANGKDLELDEEFLKKIQEEFLYIKKEFKYRKQVDDETRILTADPKKK